MSQSSMVVHPPHSLEEKKNRHLKRAGNQSGNLYTISRSVRSRKTWIDIQTLRGMIIICMEKKERKNGKERRKIEDIIGGR